jgi:hypothetical protein
MLAKKTSKNQLTLPKDIVKNFPGIEYFDALVEDNRIVLTPLSLKPATLNLTSIREKMKKLGISDADTTDAVAWARKKRRS